MNILSRTCCFNYLRKRSAPSPHGLKLELWLEKSQIEHAARTALAQEESDHYQQSLQQEQRDQREHERNIHRMSPQEQMEVGRLQTIYDELA